MASPVSKMAGLSCPVGRTRGGEYRGKLYSPDCDKTCSSMLMLNGNTLSVSG